MGKKKQDVNEVVENKEDVDDNTGIETDFDLEDEYKEDPLIPKGNYFGAVKAVKYDASKCKITWTVNIHETDEVMSDGETPVEGSDVYYTNWLPKSGDDKVMSPSGKSTKRQSKINMMKKFADGMGINMNSLGAVKEACDSGEWVGIDVVVSVDTSEYMGRVRNDVTAMVENSGE